MELGLSQRQPGARRFVADDRDIWVVSLVISNRRGFFRRWDFGGRLSFWYDRWYGIGFYDIP
jgi:hypothetical protein